MQESPQEGLIQMSNTTTQIGFWAKEKNIRQPGGFILRRVYDVAHGHACYYGNSVRGVDSIKGGEISRVFPDGVRSYHVTNEHRFNIASLYDL